MTEAVGGADDQDGEAVEIRRGPRPRPASDNLNPVE